MKTEFNLDDLHVLEVEARASHTDLRRHDLTTIKRVMVTRIAEQMFNRLVVAKQANGETTFTVRVLIEGGPDA